MRCPGRPAVRPRQLGCAGAAGPAAHTAHLHARPPAGLLPRLRLIPLARRRLCARREHEDMSALMLDHLIDSNHVDMHVRAAIAPCSAAASGAACMGMASRQAALPDLRSPGVTP